MLSFKTELFFALGLVELWKPLDCVCLSPNYSKYYLSHKSMQGRSFIYGRWAAALLALQLAQPIKVMCPKQKLNFPAIALTSEVTGEPGALNLDATHCVSWWPTCFFFCGTPPFGHRVCRKAVGPARDIKNEHRMGKASILWSDTRYASVRVHGAAPLLLMSSL